MDGLLVIFLVVFACVLVFNGVQLTPGNASEIFYMWPKLWRKFAESSNNVDFISFCQLSKTNSIWS